MDKEDYEYEKILLYVFLFLLIVKSTDSYAQTVSLNGKVKDELNKPVDYFNVLLLSPSDSSLVKGAVFTDGSFEFEDLLDRQYILRVLNIQYCVLDTLVDLSSEKRKYHYNLVLKDLSLDEVQVHATVPIVKEKLGNIELDVKNSFLKEEGSIVDILRKSPGVLVDKKGMISVLGKDHTEVYLNNRNVKSIEVLKVIQSADVDRIEIIRNPGSEYQSDANAIIKIWTKNKIDEQYNLSLSNISQQGRCYSNRSNLSLMGQLGNTMHHISYSYALDRDRQYDINDAYVFHRNDTVHNYRKALMTNKLKQHDLFYLFSFDWGQRNSLGFQYTSSISNNVNSRYNNQTIYRTASTLENRLVYVDEYLHSYYHNFSMNYARNIKDKSLFSVVSDYAFSTQSQKSFIREINLESIDKSENENLSVDNYNLFSIDANYSTPFKSFDISSGAKYSFVNDQANSVYMERLSSVRIQDKILAIYFNAKWKYKKLSLDAGVRLEHGVSEVLEINAQSDISRSYLNVFPVVSAFWKFTDRTNVSLSYSKKISRPSFDQINPRYRYLDTLSYIVGAPGLLPAITDLVELNVGLHKVHVSVGLKHVNNLIASVNVLDNNLADIIKYTFTNLPHSNFLVAGVNYSLNIPKYTLFINGLVQKPFVDMPLGNGNLHKYRMPVYRLKATSDVNLFENIHLTASFFIRSKGDIENIRFQSVSNIDLKLSRYFMKKKIFVSIEVYDLMNKFKTNCWTNVSENVLAVMNSDFDSRKFVFTIKYNWGLSNATIQSKSANKENLNRL